MRISSQRTTDAAWNVVTKELKGTSRRTIDLGSLLVDALSRRAVRQQDERLRLGLGPEPAHSDVVFVQLNGQTAVGPATPRARLGDTAAQSKPCGPAT